MIAAVGKDCCARCVPRECDFETKTINKKETLFFRRFHDIKIVEINSKKLKDVHFQRRVTARATEILIIPPLMGKASCIRVIARTV